MTLYKICAYFIHACIRCSMTLYKICAYCIHACIRCSMTLYKICAYCIHACIRCSMTLYKICAYCIHACIRCIYMLVYFCGLSFPYVPYACTNSFSRAVDIFNTLEDKRLDDFYYIQMAYTNNTAGINFAPLEFANLLSHYTKLPYTYIIILNESCIWFVYFQFS